MKTIEVFVIDYAKRPGLDPAMSDEDFMRISREMGAANECAREAVDKGYNEARQKIEPGDISADKVYQLAKDAKDGKIKWYNPFKVGEHPNPSKVIEDAKKVLTEAKYAIFKNGVCVNTRWAYGEDTRR